MTEQWKRFRPKRAEGRQDGDNRLRTLYLVFRRYEKRIAFAVAVVLIVIWGVRFLPNLRALFHRSQRPEITRLEAENLAATVRVFLGDMGRLPTEKEGLESLAVRPSSEGIERWKGPYIYEVPRDGWRQPFTYRTNGSAFIILSGGPDGQLKTQDDICVFYPDPARASFLLAGK